MHQTASLAPVKQPEPELDPAHGLEPSPRSTAQLVPQRPRARPALMLASILVTLVTAVGVTILIALVLARATP